MTAPELIIDEYDCGTPATASLVVRVLEDTYGWEDVTASGPLVLFATVEGGAAARDRVAAIAAAFNRTATAVG